eukprot:TRINITY_DN7311_c0_g1_i1.p1 TRINITY_DN7311_c0_g1~~TRINITY_DN7311_c0_g1_i1.p1  ORF type:complete len:217 (+),score=35.22 TRINITY_DN7311_c0_g1_i1:38-688(+)
MWSFFSNLFQKKEEKVVKTNSVLDYDETLLKSDNSILNTQISTTILLDLPIAAHICLETFPTWNKCFGGDSDVFRYLHLLSCHVEPLKQMVGNDSKVKEFLRRVTIVDVSPYYLTAMKDIVWNVNNIPSNIDRNRTFEGLETILMGYLFQECLGFDQLACGVYYVMTNRIKMVRDFANDENLVQLVRRELESKGIETLITVAILDTNGDYETFFDR